MYGQLGDIDEAFATAAISKDLRYSDSPLPDFFTRPNFRHWDTLASIELFFE